MAPSISRVPVLRGTFALTIVLAAAGLGAGLQIGGGEKPPAATDRFRDEEAKLQVLTERLEALKGDLASLDERETSLLGELHRLEIEIRLAREQLELTRIQLDRGYRQIDALLRQIQDLEASIQRLRPYLARRTVDLYKLGRLSYVRLLLSVEEPRELTRAYRYVSMLARADGEKVARFLADQKSLQETKSQLLTRTKEMLETKTQLESTTQALERRRTTKETLLQEIQERREMAETLMYELEAAHEKLGELITQLAQGETPNMNPVFLPIRLFRGELTWPVKGRIGTRFGKQMHPRFRTVTVQNGVEIEAPLASSVNSIYDGEVVFASWFKGYGKLLILGHPQNVHSLYGHLSDIKVKEGDVVRRGDEVAWVGDTGSLTGPSLYFEIREEGKPVDPELWLGKLEEPRRTGSP